MYFNSGSIRFMMVYFSLHHSPPNLGFDNDLHGDSYNFTLVSSSGHFGGFLSQQVAQRSR